MTTRLLTRTRSRNPPLKARSSYFNARVPVSGNKATGKTVVVLTPTGVLTKAEVAVGVVENGGVWVGVVENGGVWVGVVEDGGVWVGIVVEGGGGVDLSDGLGVDVDLGTGVGVGSGLTFTVTLALQAGRTVPSLNSPPTPIACRAISVTVMGS